MIEKLIEKVDEYQNELFNIRDQLCESINDIIKDKLEDIKFILCPDNNKYGFHTNVDVYNNYLEILFSIKSQSGFCDFGGTFNEFMITIDMDYNVPVDSSKNFDIEIVKNISVEYWNNDNYKKVLEILNINEDNYEIL